VSLVHPHPLLAVLDVLIVAFLIYRLFAMIRGTRASQMFVGLIVIVLAAIAAEWLKLETLSWLVASVRSVWVILFVVLFQPELRALLTHIGQNRLVRALIRVNESGVAGEILRAVEEMSEHRRGALIVIERDMGLRNYVETGTQLGARITAELLETIFTPPSPLHDGAAIIRGDELVAAGCILPLSDSQELPAYVGTRHRAALGLAEETDAAVIAVSEETGAVSVARKGEIRLRLDSGQLRSELAAIFTPGIEPEEEEEPSPPASEESPGEKTSRAG
jgi:diadenylate cyclase